MHLIIIFIRHINHIFNFSFWQILYLDLFCCIYTSECWCKIYLSIILYFQIWLCTYSNKCHFCIGSSHIIQMNVHIWCVCFIFWWSELNRYNCETFWFNETYFGIKSKCLCCVASHSEIYWCIRLISKLKSIINRGVQQCRLHYNFIPWINFHYRNERKRIHSKWMTNTFYDTWNRWENFCILYIFFNFGLNSLVKFDISQQSRLRIIWF